MDGPQKGLLPSLKKTQAQRVAEENFNDEDAGRSHESEQHSCKSGASCSFVQRVGKDSDWPVVKGACAQLKALEIPFEAHILSAHRTPAEAAEFAKNARAEGFGVILCAAGMAAHLAGAFAANTTLPVIGIPMKGGAMDGLDALLATVQMPSGIPVATVALNGAKNAAWLAAEILALSDDALAEKLAAERTAMAAQIAAKEEKLQAESAEL